MDQMCEQFMLESIEEMNQIDDEIYSESMFYLVDEYIDSKKENLADWERTELIRVNGEFNKAIQESPIIELTDEILMEEIKVFKTKKKFIKVYM